MILRDNIEKTNSRNGKYYIWQGEIFNIFHDNKHDGLKYLIKILRDNIPDVAKIHGT